MVKALTNKGCWILGKWMCRSHSKQKRLDAKQKNVQKGPWRGRHRMKRLQVEEDLKW